VAEAPQQVRFCRSQDGVRIAYARHGEGPPLVVTTCWLSHLQYDWESPVWRHFLEDLGAVSSMVRYDERGYGLSDWDVDDFSFERRVQDLEAVVDDAAWTGSRCWAWPRAGRSRSPTPPATPSGSPG